MRLRQVPIALTATSGVLTLVALFGAWTTATEIAPRGLCPCGPTQYVHAVAKIDGFPVVALGLALGICLASVVLMLAGHQRARITIISIVVTGCVITIVTLPLPIWPHCWGNGCSVPDILQNPNCSFGLATCDLPPTIVNHIFPSTPPGAFLAAGIAAVITAIAFKLTSGSQFWLVPFLLGNLMAGILIAAVAFPALSPQPWPINAEMQGTNAVCWAVYVALAAMALAWAAAGTSFLSRRV